MQNINVGTGPNSGDGEELRDAIIIVNENFAELLEKFDDYATDVDLSNAVTAIQVSLNQLQTEIDGKADINHTHTINEIIGLTAALASKLDVNTFNSALISLQTTLSQQQQAIAELQQGQGIEHNSLSGLQGGDEDMDQFYHLKLNELTRVRTLIYQPSVSTLAVAPTSGERGSTTALTLNYNIISNDDVITGATLTSIGSVLSNVDDGPQTVSAGSTGLTSTYNLVLSYNRNGVATGETVTTTYNAYTPQWAGTSATADFSAYTAMSASLQKFVQSSATLQRSMSPNDEYIWFISNKNNATILDQNNFQQTVAAWGDSSAEFWRKSITLTLADGVTTSTVYLYRTRLTKNFTNIIYKIQ